MRLAYFSPLPPTTSGISDYTAELLPFLARHAELELFTDAPTTLTTTLPIHPYREFFSTPRASDFDFALYHMGNSPVHAFVYESLQRAPGVLVLHDVVLHHFFAWLTIERGDARGYIELMRAAYGDAGAELAAMEAKQSGTLNRFQFPLCEPLIRNASAVIVHSEYAARVVKAVAPEKPRAVVPMGVPLPELIARDDARARTNLPTEAFVAGVFGEVTPHKRVTIALEAFRELHARLPNSLMLLVGRVSPNYDAENLIRQLGLQDAVRLVGFAPRAVYEDYVAACDVCLNLRYPTAGETSASVLRLLGAARPVIVTRADAYVELPDAACAKINADEFEREALVAHLEFFATHSEFARAMGEHGRQFVATEHTLAGAARAYAEFLNALKQGTWQREKNVQRPTSDVQRPMSSVQGPTTVNPHPIPNFESPISVAQALAELGIEADDPLLAEIARALIESGAHADA